MTSDTVERSAFQVHLYVPNLAILLLWITWTCVPVAPLMALHPASDLDAAPTPITACCFDAQAKQWIVAQGSELSIWNEDGTQLLQKVETTVEKIHDVQFNSTGDQLIVAGGTPGELGSIEQYSWPAAQLLAKRSFPTDTILRVHWVSEKNLVAAASSTGELFLLSDQGFETTWQTDAHPGGCTSVQVIPELGLVVSGGIDATIRTWNLRDGQAIRSLSQHTAPVTQLLTAPASAGERPQLVSVSEDHTIRLWDPSSGRLIRFVRLGAIPTEAVWEKKQGRELPMLWVLTDDGRLRRIDLRTATIEQDIAGDKQATFALGLHDRSLWAAGMSGRLTRIKMREPLERIGVSVDGGRFVTLPSQVEFRVRGFNYDHDRAGRLLEDYWNEQWSEVENDFCEMQQLGANTVRVHLQFGRFMNSPTEPNRQSLAKFAALVQLAERTRLYLDVTGLGCYHKQDVPDWYDALSEADRWSAQATFWKAVVESARQSPAIFCWDLMNEPVVPGGQRPNGEWLGPPFAEKHFVQFITLDPANRPRPEIAKAWIKQLAAAIRETGNTSLITVGLVDWSLDKPGLTSGFVPSIVADDLDFIAMHLYPQSGQLEKDAETLSGFRIGKPVIIEECFPLRCSAAELRTFLQTNAARHNGWVSFYWGTTPEELAAEKTIAAAITRQWLLEMP
jgi:hypothetical protein